MISNQSNHSIIIKSIYPTLSKKEKQVIDYVLENKSKVLSMTVSDLAEEVGVASSTIVRMCKNIGYSGFSEFKIELAKDNAVVLEDNILLPVIEANDSTTQVFKKVFSSSIQTLYDTLSMINIQDIETTVDLIEKARSIQFYGVGTSLSIATDAHYHLMRIGYNTYYSGDSHGMRISASRLGPEDVAIGISHCGRTIDTLETLRIAKERGAKTIAITSNTNSPICNVADITIIAYSDEVRYSIEAVSSRLAHIAILDAICVALSLKSSERTTESVMTANSVIKSLRVNKNNKE